MRPLLAALMLTGFVAAAPVPKALKKKRDTALAVGTWKPADDHSAWFQFSPDGTLKTWHGTPTTSHDNMDWTYSFDAEATPKRVRLTRVPAEQGYYVCVYELDGDTLKIGILTGTDQIPNKVEPGSGIQFHDTRRDESKW